jgi:hypothetical protein
LFTSNRAPQRLDDCGDHRGHLACLADVGLYGERVAATTRESPDGLVRALRDVE